MTKLAGAVRLAGLALTGMCAATAVSQHAPDVPLPLEQALSFIPQLFILSLVLAGGFALRRDWVWCTVNLAAAAVFAVCLRPFVPGIGAVPVRGSTPPDRLEPFTIVHANVLYGNSHGDKVVEFIEREQPLIAFLVELDDGLHKAIEPLHAHYPYRAPADNESPTHIQLLSRVPFSSVSVRYLLDPLRPIVDATIPVGGTPVHIVAVHVAAPVSWEKLDLRNVELREISRYLGAIDGPFVVLGDLNTTMWSPVYRSFTAASGAESMRSGRGIMPSWFLTDPKWFLFGTPIDHVLVGGGVFGMSLELGPDIGSDHLPLLARLAVAAAQAPTQP